jgi:hypothetical protein
MLNPPTTVATAVADERLFLIDREAGASVACQRSVVTPSRHTTVRVMSNDNVTSPSNASVTVMDPTSKTMSAGVPEVHPVVRLTVVEGAA